jgi:hypothetical protein
VITFRYHIVSIVAVFLALATGVALGAGPLKGPVDDGLAAQAEQDRQDKMDLRGEIATLERTDDFDAAFTAQVAPSLVANRLAGRAISILVLPEADGDVAEQTRDMLTEAGASVGPLVELTAELLDSRNKQVIDELTVQLADLPGVRFPADASTYDRAGALLARALVTPADAGSPPDDAARTVLSTLRTAKLAVPEDDVARRSSLLLILTGPRSGTDELAQAQDAILVALARALDERCDGVVVGGPPSAAREGGPIAAVRDDGQTADLVSTVDVLTAPSGQVSAVFALAQQALGERGHYGAIGNTDGALAPLQGLTEDQ